MRFKTWTLNKWRREAAQRSKSLKDEDIANRKSDAVAFDNLPEVELALLRADYELEMLAKSCEPEQQDEDTPVPWSPFGLSSMNFAFAEGKLQDHIHTFAQI